MLSNKELHKQTSWSVIVLSLIYSALYLIHGTVAGLDVVSRLKPGLWFSWQPFVVGCVMVGSLVEMRESCDERVAVYHSVTVFASRRRGVILATIVWARSLFCLSLLTIDIVYLILQAMYCFSLNCSIDPTAQCCVEGTLYGFALIGVLLQILVATVLLWVTSRMPLAPSYYISDPIDADMAVAFPPTMQSSTAHLYGHDMIHAAGTDFKST